MLRWGRAECTTDRAGSGRCQRKAEPVAELWPRGLKNTSLYNAELSAHGPDVPCAAGSGSVGKVQRMERVEGGEHGDGWTLRGWSSDGACQQRPPGHQEEPVNFP